MRARIAAALQAGRAVVTADKQVIAEYPCLRADLERALEPRNALGLLTIVYAVASALRRLKPTPK